LCISEGLLAATFSQTQFPPSVKTGVGERHIRTLEYQGVLFQDFQCMILFYTDFVITLLGTEMENRGLEKFRNFKASK
jgi:hypothetical protein